MNGARLPGMERQAGIRLSKIELYNWGTFDGAVHGFHPRGEWALLVGENGTGKSTIVDALLTLLVRPNTRKYNFASGASKTERDERTYIQGAYDKTRINGGTPQLSYLRPGNKSYSALLACFENAESRKTFTVCQILYLDSNNKPRKFYAFDGQRERGIAEDLGNITDGASVLATLKSRDFKATDSYTQYFEWLRRALNCRPKAMDMFNQAAWVKDVNQLDSFVREQMLEKKPWDEKVAQLLKHFSELSDAHRALVIVRDQAKLLDPIIENGARYRIAAKRLSDAKDQLDATSLYFSFSTQRLLEPLCHEWTQRLRVLEGQIKSNEDDITQAHREVARIELEVAGAGGERMRRLPGLIEHERQLAEIRKQARIKFEMLLRQAGVETSVDSADALSRLLTSVTSKQEEVVKRRKDIQRQCSLLQYELGQLKQRISNDRDELESLQKRKGNMPRELVFIRDEICRELKLSAKDLPFAAELMSVDPNYREWEASVEQVLNGFARDLLVKERYYAKVSGFIDHKRVVDHEGRGQRLSYTRVSGVEGVSKPNTSTSKDGQSLLDMLNFREENDLAPWVRGQVSQRFDFLACESIEEFQATSSPAMTKNRHTKQNRFQHRKDDRGESGDRKRFILGWENREKILALGAAIESGEVEVAQLEGRETGLLSEVNSATNTIHYLQQVLETEDYDAIDDSHHRKIADQLDLELERLKSSNDKIRELEDQKRELEKEITEYKNLQRELTEDRTRTEMGLKNGQAHVKSCANAVEEAKRDGSFEKHQPQFGLIDEQIAGTPLSLDNLTTLPLKFQTERYDEVAKLENVLVPIQKALTSLMGRFLTKFPSFQLDMDYNVESLPQFIALHDKIRKDDLPRHEERFKKRLNENVLTEVGVMHSHLENEREEIIRKIEEINEGLERMEWRDGTHVRLEPEDSKDPEIRDFRRELAGCLTGYLDGTNQANEDTFLRIQKLVVKLQDDKNVRWREKVIDVRKWFSFSAQEFITETGEAGSYYDGGSGKSGGEKAKLAFLVLVAAIVYQYDIDPDDDSSEKFCFVMVDEMFSRTATKYARYALDLFKQFGLQLLVVAPLDAKARVCEPYVGVHAHVVKDLETNRSEILSYTSEQYRADIAARKRRS